MSGRPPICKAATGGQARRTSAQTQQNVNCFLAPREDLQMISRIGACRRRAGTAQHSVLEGSHGCSAPCRPLGSRYEQSVASFVLGSERSERNAPRRNDRKRYEKKENRVNVPVLQHLHSYFRNLCLHRLQQNVLGQSSQPGRKLLSCFHRDGVHSEWFCIVPKNRRSQSPRNQFDFCFPK